MRGPRWGSWSPDLVDRDSNTPATSYLQVKNAPDNRGSCRPAYKCPPALRQAWGRRNAQPFRSISCDNSEYYSVCMSMGR